MRNEACDQPIRCTLCTPRSCRMYSTTVSSSSKSVPDVLSVNGYECAHVASRGFGIKRLVCWPVGALHGSSIFGRGDLPEKSSMNHVKAARTRQPERPVVVVSQLRGRQDRDAALLNHENCLTRLPVPDVFSNA